MTKINHLSDYKIIKKSKFFDKRWYKKQNACILKGCLDPIEHYLSSGWKQGFAPGPKFDGNAYLRAYPDVDLAGMNPLLHYERFGKKEKRSIFTVSGFKHYQQCFPTFTKKLIKRRAKSNPKILVILHLFYMHEWPYIANYLKNLDTYNYKLVVTLIEGNFDTDTLEQIKQFKPDVTFKIYENRGFDIGSFIDIIKNTDLNAFDIVFKLQSKGIKRPYIFIYNQIFRWADWFFNLYNGILGYLSVDKTIKMLTYRNKIGLVAAKNLIIQDPKHKQFFTNQKSKELGINIKENYKYVAGTCFAIRAHLLKPIQDLKITFSDFEQVKRGTFSLAHAMERIVCACIEPQGYTLFGIRVKHNKYTHKVKREKKFSAIRLLDDPRFVLDYDFFYKILELRKIKKYSIEYIKLGDIRRYWEGKLYSLTETSPYKYLKTNDDKLYKKYCTINSKNSLFDMSKKRFSILLKSLNSGYQERMMPVLEQKNLAIMDGQHRCCYLLNKYGPNHKIKCLIIHN